MTASLGSATEQKRRKPARISLDASRIGLYLLLMLFALIFLGIGLGDIFTWDLFWPIILIILGASIVLRGILRGRK